MSKISELTKLTNVDLLNDILPIVDSSEGTTKGISPKDILGHDLSTAVQTAAMASTLHIMSNFRIDGVNEHTEDVPSQFSGYGICLTLGVSSVGWYTQILFDTNRSISTRIITNFGINTSDFTPWKYIS